MSHYSSKDLRGLKIDHDLDEFQEGEEIILTLKDESILNDDKKGLKNAADILENVNLQDNAKHNFAIQQKERMKNLGNEHLEEKYNPDEKKLLSQYDEQKLEKSGFTLDELGSYDQEKIKKLNEIKEKLLKKSGKQGIDLNIQKKVASEYFTASEMAKFNKPSKLGQKRQAKEFLNFLEDNADEDNQDHGNRISKQVKKNDQNSNTTSNLENYQMALEKAQKQAQETHKYNLFSDEETEQLEKALINQRKLAQQKQKKVEDYVKEFIETDNQTDKKDDCANLRDFSNLQKLDGGKQDVKTIVNSTEFLKNVRTYEELNESEKLIIQPTTQQLSQSGGTQSVVSVSLPSERYINSQKQNQDGLSSIVSHVNMDRYRDKNKYQQQKEGYKSDDDDQILQDTEKLREEIGFTEEVADQGVGIAATLKKLRERGSLHHDGVDFQGRNKDKNPIEEMRKLGDKNEGTDHDRIKLEYRDDRGKLMTKKEAFRHMCWKFHGRGPSRNKIEKALKKEQLSKQIKQIDVTNNPLMKALKQSQKTNNQSYMILSRTKQD